MLTHEEKAGEFHGFMVAKDKGSFVSEERGSSPARA
jgi:hypothetical protein